ncbi:hypothetical protein MMC25_008207 [Agyrium rufum]|nr:hypothetical protein [Agyrium rufum]
MKWPILNKRVSVAYDGGLGWPNTQVTPAALVREVKIGLAGQTNWPIAVGLIKVSICLTFIRIFFTRKFRIYATVVYGLCIAWTVATVLVGYTICIPLSAQWDLTSTGNCGNETAAYVSLGVLDAATDIAVFLLPLPMLYTLQVPMHTKIALISTFGLGIFTIASSILRLVSVIQIDFNQDFEQGQVNDVLWCSIECSVGLIVASSLVMRPLLDRGIHLLSRITGSSRGSSTMRGSESSGSGSAGLGMGNIVDIRASTSKASRDGTLVGDCSDEYERILKTTQSGFTEEGTKGHDFRDDNVV